MVVKTRFHKGTTRWLRDKLRAAGLAVDEELAQLIMSGRKVLLTSQQALIENLQHSAWQDRIALNRDWEEAHPDRNPFPKPFAQRVLELARDARNVIATDGDPSYYIDEISSLCRAELDDDLAFLPPDLLHPDPDSD